MSRRLGRGLAYGALTGVLFAGLGLLFGQQAERAADEATETQLRPAEGLKKRANPISALPVEAPLGRGGRGSGPFAAPQTPDKDAVDTSRNKRVAVQIKNAPAATLSGAVARQYSGVAGVYLVPEAVSNSLLVSAPLEFIEEILKTLQTLDRAPLSIAVEVTIAEFSPTNGAAGQKSIRTADFNGSADKVRDALQEHFRTGKVQRLKRFQMLAVNNQTTMLQDNDDRPAAPGAPNAAPQAAGVAQVLPNGTTVTLTARVVPGQGVVMELVVHDPPRQPAGW